MPPTLSRDLEGHEPLPPQVGRDYISLLVQSPYRLHLYWGFAHDPHATLRRAIGPSAADYKLLLRVTKLANDSIVYERELGDWRSEWIDAEPGATYKADIGLHAPTLPVVHLLTSNEATTPDVTARTHAPWPADAAAAASVSTVTTQPASADPAHAPHAAGAHNSTQAPPAAPADEAKAAETSTTPLAAYPYVYL